MIARYCFVSLLLLGSCASADTDTYAEIVETAACETAEKIGNFDPSKDLFAPQFDLNADVDDMHSVAAVGSLLRLPEMACVRVSAVSGAYGRQTPKGFIQADQVFDAAFGADWLDGHGARQQAVETQAKRFLETLRAGGHVWVADGGQSDLTADAVRLVQSLDPALPLKTHIHVIQHSNWNEKVVTQNKLDYLKATVDYRRIPDGNSGGNGSPGYASKDGSWWPAVLADPVVGPIWQTAKQRADEANPVSPYNNPFIEAGGFDFSDTVETAFIFGFEDLGTIDRFFEKVLVEPVVTWPGGARAALALTYDDALISQLDYAVPQLDAHGFKGTFYLSLAINDFEAQKAAWASVAANGHELGNHTLYHPCRASLPGRDWVAPNRDLDTYSKPQLLDEIAAANAVLQGIDGQERRTFAYTCGDTEVGGESFISELEPLFMGARSVVRDAPFERYFVPSFAVDQTPASEMIAYVDELIETGSIGTITFHDVGGPHLAVTAEAHAALLAHLKARQSEIWVAPLRDILDHLEEGAD